LNQARPTRGATARATRLLLLRKHTPRWRGRLLDRFLRPGYNEAVPATDGSASMMAVGAAGTSFHWLVADSRRRDRARILLLADLWVTRTNSLATIFPIRSDRRPKYETALEQTLSSNGSRRYFWAASNRRPNSVENDPLLLAVPYRLFSSGARSGFNMWCQDTGFPAGETVHLGRACSQASTALAYSARSRPSGFLYIFWPSGNRSISAYN
jgi:hypothetical protein